MHEMGIMNDVLITCENIAREAGKDRITHVALTIGEMTDIQDFALEFAFEALRDGTMAQDATLEMVFVEPRSRCNSCGKVYEHDRYTMLCPHCGSFEVTLLQGRELQIDTIEAEDEEDQA
ncbi:MAG: hydrogenase maturation nickel metallochaperone HypA [Actinomycetia bacterium]|nr:hydrogenase maturation nickel metallochaperone HypA [Actinomycetes bacterium]